jgi:hypothetical protein
MFALISIIMLGAFEMPELELPAISADQTDELLASLPHTDTMTDRLLVRGEEPVLEDAVVRAGGFYRYALDLYQLDKDHYSLRIKDNLTALSEELSYIGDQGEVTVAKRITEVGELQKAMDEGVETDSVLKLFQHLDTELRTLFGEYRPNGVYAYDLGNWATAIGIRIAFYPGCADEVCQSLVLSNINILIEKVENEDSDRWNKVVLALPREEIYIDDLIGSVEFLSGLPYYPIITDHSLDDLLKKLHVVYKVFNLEFVA